MIITITGKPCSGKGTAAKEFCKKYNFEYICTGDMFREHAKRLGYDNILTFQEEDPRVKEVDNIVDSSIIKLGKEKINNNIVIDSRLAWHFIPNSFKVFIDVDATIAGKRLLEANRETEKTTSISDAIKQLESRWNVENERYNELYQINNLNLNNYNLVVDSSNLTPLDVAEIIYKEYEKFSNKR